jgi:hypothetical protein
MSTDGDVLEPRPSSRTGNVGSIISSRVSSQGVDLLDIIGRQIDLLEVLLDARGRDGLGDDTVAAHLGPREAANEC